MTDLVVIGDICPDILLTGDDVRPLFGQSEKVLSSGSMTIGGSAVITACGAARLGASTTFMGVVGDDALGDFMLQGMRDQGIDTSFCVVDPAIRTGFGVHLIEPEDRAILTFPGSIAELRRQHLDECRISSATHLHIGGAFLLESLLPDLDSVMSKARNAGVTVSLDLNWDPRGRWDASRLLASSDVVLPNKSEALHLADATDIEFGLETLGRISNTVAIKLGAEGALAIHDGTVVRLEALPVTIADDVGAGDSFDAGFIHGFTHGWDLTQTLNLANACGSMSMRSAGGTEGQPTLAEALGFLEATQ